MIIKKLFISLILGLSLSLSLVGLMGSGLTFVHAAGFTVDILNDENDGSCAPGDCSLREAIIAANGNGEADTITLGPGNYVLSIPGTGDDTGATGDLDITEPLTITGAGPAQTIIDANHIDRVFHNLSGEGTTVVISGVTIANGFTVSGGGIYNSQSDLVLNNVIIVDNTTSNVGGGIFVNSGNLTLQDTQILSNTAASRGGGIYFMSDTSYLMTQRGDSIIAYNQSNNRGGGVDIPQGGRLTMESGRIVSNTATLYGGGLFLNSVNALLGEVEISGNTANLYGGGVYILANSTTVSGTRIISNVAQSRGGGVYVDTSGAQLIQTGNSVIANNRGTANNFGGGGIFIYDGQAILSDGQVVNNSAVYGGGVYVRNTTAGLIQTGTHIMANNTASVNGGGVYVNVGSAMLQGGEIVSNTAGYGGGVYGNDVAALTQTGTNVIAYNTAITNGGGIYLYRGAAALQGGEIISNTAENGGGMYVEDATSAFTQTGTSIIAYNKAAIYNGGGGGGVYIDEGKAILNGGQIHDNKANANGGGVYLNYGSAMLNAGQIRGNSARYGGGVYVNNTSAAFTQTGVTTISHNTSSNGGGGVTVSNGSVTLSGGTIRENLTGSNGGGLSITGANAKVNVSRSQIVNNTAFHGGGIAQANGRLTLINTTVSGNKAASTGDGGGLYVSNGTAVLTYTTVASNTAASGGQGIHRTGGSVVLQNTLVAYNGTANCNTGLTSNGYNLDSGNTCGFGTTGDQPNTDPLLGPLADNGGNTLTHFLLEDSPAMNQGICVAGITTDQRGEGRSQQGTSCDIGAVEADAGGAVYLPIILRN